MVDEKVAYTKADFFYARLNNLLVMAHEHAVQNSLSGWVRALDLILIELEPWLRKETKEKTDAEYFNLKINEAYKLVNQMQHSRQKEALYNQAYLLIRQIHKDIMFMIDKYNLLLPKTKLPGSKEALHKAMGVEIDE